MDRIAVLLILFFCYTCLGAKQTFYLSETGGTSTTCSLDDPCGSLGNIIPLIRNVDPYQVEVNIFPGFYNESSTRITFPDQTLVTLQKYDPNETGETVTFLGIGSSLIFSSSVTITGITFQEYDAFLTMATPTAETNIQISNSNFITISTLLTNIKDATVVLTNISMSTVDKNNIGSLYRRGLFTPPNSLEYPKSFSIIGGTFDNLKYGQYIIDIQCDYFEMVNASFTRSGRMHIRSDNGSIIGTSFVDLDGMEREGGYAGCKCALMLTGHWTLEDSWMGGYTTTFTGFIVDVGDLNLTMVNSSPGYFDIFSSIFYADNCEFFGTISAFDIEFVNCKLGSNWVVRPSLTGSGMISNSTVYQYDIFGAISFEDSAVTSSKLQLEPYGYPGSLPTTHVEFTNSNFTNISEGVQIRQLTVNVANSYFSNCYSSDSGGALYVIDGNTQIIDSTFTSNTAASIGGAIFAKSDNNVVMNVNIEGSVFETNTANLGGAIACSGKVTILNSDDATFEGNIATYYQQDPNFYCGTTDAPVTNPDSAASLVWLWILLSILVTVVVLLAIFVVIATIITLVKRYRAKEDFDIEPDRNLPY